MNYKFLLLNILSLISVLIVSWAYIANYADVVSSYTNVVVAVLIIPFFFGAFSGCLVLVYFKAIIIFPKDINSIKFIMLYAAVSLIPILYLIFLLKLQ